MGKRLKVLALDVGNTSVALGLWSAGSVSFVSHHDGGFAEAAEAAEKIVAKGDVEVMGFLSVVPGENARWRRFAKRLGLEFIEIGWQDFTLGLDYPHPETIGADRLADAAAAVDRYGAPVIICDFGTAFTAAAVTKDCVWRGGAIAPGFPLMSDYLYERTAKLPRMKLGGKCPKIGRSTEEAMRFGAMVGYRGMVREIVSTLKQNFNEQFRLVATGGFAKWALAGSGMDFIIDPVLTLHGAGLLAERAFIRRKE